MQKQRIVLCIALVLVLALSTCLLFACAKDDNKSVPAPSSDHELNLEEGTYPSALPSNFQGDELAKLNAALTSTDTEEIRRAVLLAYNVANRSRRTAENSLMTQYTDAGLMVFRGFELKSGNAWYYELPTESIIPSLPNTLFAYTLDSETFYFVRLDDGSAPKCHDIDTFPYSSFVFTTAPTAYDFDGFKEARFFLDDQLELCNMKFSLALIDDSSTITYDADKHIYTVNLVVNCSVDHELMQEWYDQAFKEGNKYSPTRVKNRYYKYWNAKIEIWENGYVKFLRYDEKWESDISIIGSTATSEFKFYYESDEMMALLKQDPRYNSKTEEEKAEITDFNDFIVMYSGAELQKAPLKPWEIAVIVLACVIFAVIAIVVGIEVAVKHGRLPKLAAKREADKQKRLAKKNANKNRTV